MPAQGTIPARLLADDAGGRAGTLHLGRLEIDPAARLIRLDGRARSLPATQFALLEAMAREALATLDALQAAGPERLAAAGRIGQTLADAVAGAAADATPARRTAEGR